MKRLLEENYSTAPDGLPGNDDTGTMSAWALFSMMGLYPDTPGEPYYTITTPRFDRVQIATERGEIVIEVERPRLECEIIEQMWLGGKSLTTYRIAHDELMRSKQLKLKLR